MAFSHSFSDSFYGDLNECGPCDRPTTLADAIASIDKELWAEMARELFDDCKPEFLTVDAVYDMARETDTCTDLSSPVCVWIDSEGYYTVEVYESND